eukprot:1157760-Pelagomonas_calceolata.AAC.4
MQGSEQSLPCKSTQADDSSRLILIAHTTKHPSLVPAAGSVLLLGFTKHWPDAMLRTVTGILGTICSFPHELVMAYVPGLAIAAPQAPAASTAPHPRACVPAAPGCVWPSHSASCAAAPVRPASRCQPCALQQPQWRHHASLHPAHLPAHFLRGGLTSIHINSADNSAQAPLHLC